MPLFTLTLKGMEPAPNQNNWVEAKTRSRLI